MELAPTKDVWAVDYMPVQVRKDKFVPYKYQPDYLQSKKWKPSISDTTSIMKQLPHKVVKSDIILDGGNAIPSANKVILTDKIFYENKHLERNELLNKFKEHFEVDKIILIPVQPGDFTGHADGLVRFINDDKVLMNEFDEYTEREMAFKRAIYIALDTGGLQYETFPCRYDGNKNNKDASGSYINFLQMQDLIVMPTYQNKKEINEEAKLLLEKLFTQKIVTVAADDLAVEGYVLNCITWNVLE